MSEINASIITVGDELLIGQTIDTNSAFIAQEFNTVGIWVKRRVAVGDVYEEIWKALDEESKNSHIVIITGGLGPTADDITKPLLCEYFGGTMVLNEDVLQHVEHLLKNVYRRPGVLLERNKKQAEVPDNCTVLHNELGTAPGMWFEKENANGEKIIFVSLPGVPFEMKGLIKNEVIPKLLATFHLPVILHRSVFTAGLGESAVAERLIDFESRLPEHIKLAYLPSYGMVRLRLTARGKNREELEKEITRHHRELVGLVNDILVSNDGKPLEVVVGEILKQQGKTLSTAESCTGGYIAHLITSIAGSSQYYMGSVVSYSNEVKKKLLHVAEDTLTTVGAVSEETVTQMLQGALQTLETDYAIATSGIMGPDGGTNEKPVGTVWIAAGNKEKIVTRLLHLRFDRERNITLTALNALNLLRQLMLENN
jgi:nicotinamide-nucleotide amidase